MSKTAQETYLDRIKAIKSKRKITNDRLSDMTGIPLGTLSKLLAGINDSPKLSNIVAISEALDCSLDYLITGVPQNTNNFTLDDEEILFIDQYRALDSYGRTMVKSVLQMEQERVDRQKDELAAAIRTAEEQAVRRVVSRRHSDAVRHRYTTVHPHPEDIAVQTDTPSMAEHTAQVLKLPSEIADQEVVATRRSVPLYDLPVSAGTGEFLTDEKASMFSIPDVPQTAQVDFALHITGDSMEPRYLSGDILLIQRTDSVARGELGIFILDGTSFFKQYDGDRLLSLNPAYPPIQLKDYAAVSCCGRVINRLRRK